MQFHVVTHPIAVVADVHQMAMMQYPVDQGGGRDASSCRSKRCSKDDFRLAIFARSADVIHFVNADLIAAELSPLEPGLAAVRAGRLVLQESGRLAVDRADVALESTLSSLGYARRIRAWKRTGYRVEMVCLKLESSRLVLRRIASRV